MWLSLLIFALLAVMTNTAIPLQFDPVLLCFATRQSLTGAILLAIMGAAGATVGAMLDLRLARIATNGIWKSRSGWRLPGHEHFCALAALAAFLPVPFTPVRAALLVVRPQPRRYMLAIMSGRLPRYLLEVIVLKRLHLSGHASETLLAAFVGVAVLLCVAHLVCTRVRRSSGTWEVPPSCARAAAGN